MTSLFSPDDTWPLLALMLAGTAAAIWLEQRYRWGMKLSAPIIALLIAMALSNARLVPMEAPVYDFVGTWLVPLALPLLLFRANVFRIAKQTGRMLLSFHISSAGTLIGAVLAFFLLRSFIPEPANAAGIMTGSYIGGMVNFMAISESTRAAGSMTSALIVADNLVMAALILVMLSIAGSRFFQSRYPSAIAETARADDHSGTERRKDVTVLDLALCLAVAAVVTGTAMTIKKGCDVWFAPAAGDPVWTGMLKSLLTNRFVLITACSLLVSTFFSRHLEKVSGPEQIGGFLLYLYLFTVGLPADLYLVMAKAPLLFAFCAIMAFTNLAFTLAVGRALRLPLEELLLSVNANVGGPPSAAAMAVAKGWHPLVLPAILAGIWGYIIGTPLGLLIVSLFK